MTNARKLLIRVHKVVCFLKKEGSLSSEEKILAYIFLEIPSVTNLKGRFVHNVLSGSYRIIF